MHLKYKYIKPKENNFCVQEPSGLGGSDGDSFFSGTEDCLYLDIKDLKRLIKNYCLLCFGFMVVVIQVA